MKGFDFMFLILNKDKKLKINRINKIKGLMFKKEAINEGYIFYNCGSIHTFFMKQEIDVIVIDKDNKIVKMKSNFKKNKILISKGTTTLELPLNTCKYFKLNDKIKIID